MKALTIGWMGHAEALTHVGDYRGPVALYGKAERSIIASGTVTDGDDGPVLGDVKPTTERCPWCWNVSKIAVAKKFLNLALTEHAAQMVESGWTPDGGWCPVCGGRGSCDPIPARGKQGIWDWTPEKVAA